MFTEQIKNSFCAVTRNKIVKGALIAVSGSAALGLLDYVGALKIDNPALASFIAFVVPTLVNVVREYMKGK